MTLTDRVGDAHHRDEPSAARLRVRRFRVPILSVALFAIVVVTGGIIQLLMPVPLLALPIGIGLAVSGVVAYRRLSRTVELRADVSELTPSGKWRDLRLGTLVGAMLFTVLMLLIGMFGGWEQLAWGSVGGFLATAGLMACVAVTEETLFRGLIFRVLEERVGTVLALAFSSVLFGLTHLVNENATLWGTLSIGLTGGVMLAAAYLVTRSLWLPIGLHFAWNLTHAGVFGVVISGSDTPPEGLLNLTLSGPSLLTGGAFGPEASLLALLVCLVPTVFLLRKASRTGQIRPRPKKVDTISD
ncbi:CPBP family intramembrane glutamic endopeptidase [Actinoalloteichus hymeniacidonis]|uniref:Metal-dependent membrane protease n=1 Tax=Actinoalloteichus hymeniacidonis TaxID=340345 RepID=A0AAC9MXU2_9PSEU|nr:type II CAAX endopeptidase family protein [Actinoalloteichus hymeniacidonis]AOS62191.1 putative metal-dependent membrane protease [Actinoalloteichus hymeniacidonis]MBB5909784.1 hypothetical protein [Actinoalloteichus hymeniacidonis]